MSLPLFEDEREPQVKVIELPDDDAELMRISQEGILSLSLEDASDSGALFRGVGAGASASVGAGGVADRCGTRMYCTDVVGTLFTQNFCRYGSVSGQRQVKKRRFIRCIRPM